MAELGDTRALGGRPVVDFSWSPVGAALAFTIAGNNYPPAGVRFASNYTPINQVITFTSSVITPPSLPIIEYSWDLGDGTRGFGAVITHTYRIPNSSLAVTLRATDSLNRVWSVQKIILLQPLSNVLVGANPRVA